MRSLYIFLLLFFVIPVFAFASSATTSVSISSDAYVNEINKTRNYGSSQDLFVQSGQLKNKRALLFFNMPSLPENSVIEKAELNIYANEIPALQRVYNLYRLSEGFLEGNGGVDNDPAGEVTWDNKPLIENTISASTTTPSIKNSFMKFDITSDVSLFHNQSLENYGFVILDSVENEEVDTFSNFRPKEYASASRRPFVEITYSLPTHYISGKVFDDLNQNAVQDEGESLLNSVSVSLSGKLASTTSTDSLGNYTFGPLFEGDYTVCVSLNSNQVQTTPTSNTDCQNNSSFKITFDLNTENYQNQDFGIFTDNTPPSLPNIISPLNNQDLSVGTTTFSWQDSSDVSLPVYYIFEYSNSSTTKEGSFFENPIYQNSSTTSSSIDLKITDLGTYYFHLKSCDKFNNCSDFTNLYTFNIKEVEAKSESSSSSSNSSVTPPQSSGGSNGQIIGSGFSAPSIPVNVNPFTLNIPEVKIVATDNPPAPKEEKNVQVALLSKNSNTNTNLSFNKKITENVVDKKEVADNIKDDKENLKTDETVLKTTNDSQLANVSSLVKIDWKLYLILIIIVVLGGFVYYIFTKNKV